MGHALLHPEWVPRIVEDGKLLERHTPIASHHEGLEQPAIDCGRQQKETHGTMSYVINFTCQVCGSDGDGKMDERCKCVSKVMHARRGNREVEEGASNG